MNRRDALAASGILLAGCATGAAPGPRRRAIDALRPTWSHGHDVTGASRILFVSGQVPEDAHGNVPGDFRGQCRLAWANVSARLTAADMTLSHLASFRIFLSDRRYAAEEYEVRQQVLGTPAVPPAMTIVIATIYDERWLLEIEAIAVA